jgi:preprotein translocase subunit YajC
VLSLIHLIAADSGGSGSSGVAVLLPLVLMGGIFYFLLIRPQQRRAKAQRALFESVDVGDEVITIGGIYGTVRETDDESVTVEVAPGIDLRFLKSAIARKVVYDDELEDEPEHEDEEAGDQK